VGQAILSPAGGAVTAQFTNRDAREGSQVISKNETNYFALYSPCLQQM